jgi:Cache domain
MAEQRYNLDTKVFTAFFLAAMPFVAFGSFIVVNQAKNLLRESVGSSLEQRAVETQLALEGYIADQVVHLRLLASDPDVRSALAKSLPPLREADPRTLEQAWASGKDAKLNAALLGSSLAARTRPLTLVRPAFRQIQLVDGSGRLVAASARGGRLFNADNAWWKALAAQEGAAEAFVGEPFRPAGSTLALFEIAVPVRDEAGVLVGAAHALIDAADLYGVVAPVRIGRTGHAVLVRATDGLVLASDESDRVLTRSLPGFAGLKNAVEGFPLGESGQQLFGVSGQRRGYWTIPAVSEPAANGHPAIHEPARLVGFSPVDQVAGVLWLVTVEQDLSEALAPVEGVTRYLWVHFVGVFATVILLALYFSFKLKRPIMDEGLHVHEEHVPTGVRTAAS